MKSQSEEVMEILQAQIPRLLAQDPKANDEFRTDYSAALAVIRSLEDAGIIGDSTLLMLASEALKKRNKTKEVGLSLLAFEWDTPSLPPWERGEKVA